jgi:hypothetical protein
MMLKWLIAAVIIYGGFVALLYLARARCNISRQGSRTKSSMARKLSRKWSGHN